MNKNICDGCRHWRKKGVRINYDNRVVDIGLCNNRRSLMFRVKTEQDDTCEYGEWEKIKHEHKI